MIIKERGVQQLLKNMDMSPLFSLDHSSNSQSPLAGAMGFAETCPTAQGVYDISYRHKRKSSIVNSGKSCIM